MNHFKYKITNKHLLEEDVEVLYTILIDQRNEEYAFSSENMSMSGSVSAIKADTLLMERHNSFMFKMNTMIELLINYGCFIKY